MADRRILSTGLYTCIKMPQTCKTGKCQTSEKRKKVFHTRSMHNFFSADCIFVQSAHRRAGNIDLTI